MIQSFNGKSPSLGKNVYIHESAVVIGDVTLGDDVSIWPNAVIRGDMNAITIGARTNVQDGSVIHVAPTIPTHIGSDVTIGHLVHLHGCIIHDHVIVGSTAVILDGAEIHSDVIVGAGSLVVPRTQVESGVLMTGSPASVKRMLSDQDKAHIRLNAQEYVRIHEEYLKEESE